LFTPRRDLDRATALLRNNEADDHKGSSDDAPEDRASSIFSVPFMKRRATPARIYWPLVRSAPAKPSKQGQPRNDCTDQRALRRWHRRRQLRRQLRFNFDLLQPVQDDRGLW